MENVRAGISAVAQGSDVLITWALAIVAGSVVAIVGTSYFRPRNLKSRLMYLLFIPGWAGIGASVYYGDRVSRRFIAAQFGKEEHIRSIGIGISREFAEQRFWLQMSLLCFAGWLVSYLIWWVFSEAGRSGSTKTGGER